jgi:outer membrane protein TolC
VAAIWLAALQLLLAPGGAMAAESCARALAAPAALPTGAERVQARERLRDWVGQAVARSGAADAARWQAEAAQDDLREARAALGPQASLGATLGPQVSQAAGNTETSAAQWRASLGVSQLLYDGGRADALVQARRLQADAVRLGWVNQQEQLALGTVAAALEWSRYRSLLQVMDDYQRSAACLTAAMEQVVAADRGRLSELVQARKSLAQVQLTRHQIDAQARQSELRLRRFVGDASLDDAGLRAAVDDVPGLQALWAQLERAPEVAQARAQAAAADAQARSAAASLRPQLSLSAGLAHTGNAGGSLPGSHGAAANVTLALNVPLWSPGSHAAADAALKRALAAQRAGDDALEVRRHRVTDLHDQARTALERERLTAAVVRDSAQLYGYTLQQWQQLGRRSLFDVMAAESDHFGLRIAQENARHDAQQLNANLHALGGGLLDWLGLPR